MTLIADILLAAGALGAALYCLVLARRLRQFNDLRGGMGNAIAVLSAQVDDMTKALGAARSSASDSTRTLDELTDRAESVAQRLEILCASMHDVPTKPAPNAAPRPSAAPEPTQDTGAGDVALFRHRAYEAAE